MESMWKRIIPPKRNSEAPDVSSAKCYEAPASCCGTLSVNCLLFIQVSSRGGGRESKAGRSSREQSVQEVCYEQMSAARQ